MSKSLGNVLWAKDVVDKLGTNLTRWLVSSVHYRKELNFSDETIETARKELERVLLPLRQADVKAALNGVTFADTYDEGAYRQFLDQMDDDMNTPNAYAVIFETVKKLNGALRHGGPALRHHRIPGGNGGAAGPESLLPLPQELYHQPAPHPQHHALWSVDLCGAAGGH